MSKYFKTNKNDLQLKVFYNQYNHSGLMKINDPDEDYDPYGSFFDDEPVRISRTLLKGKKMEVDKEVLNTHMLHHINCPAFNSLCAILCVYFIAKIILLLYNAGEMHEVVMKFVE